MRYAGAKGQLTCGPIAASIPIPWSWASRQFRRSRFKSITVRLRQSLRNLIEAILRGGLETHILLDRHAGADVAETVYTPFRTEPDATPVRLVVRRVRPSPGSQLALLRQLQSITNFITDRQPETLYPGTGRPTLPPR